MSSRHTIRKDTLVHIMNQVCGLDREICGNLRVTKSSGLILDGIKEGEDRGTGIERKRATCKHTVMSTYIFHTHPHTSYAYVSVEDINRVATYKKLKTSVVATSWGVWQITKTDKETREFTSDELKEISKYLNTLGVRTSHEHKSIQWSNDVAHEVYDCLKALNKYLEWYSMFITFTSWNNIVHRDDYNLPVIS